MSLRALIVTGLLSVGSLIGAAPVAQFSATGSEPAPTFTGTFPHSSHPHKSHSSLEHPPGTGSFSAPPSPSVTGSLSKRQDTTFTHPSFALTDALPSFTETFLSFTGTFPTGLPSVSHYSHSVPIGSFSVTIPFISARQESGSFTGSFSKPTGTPSLIARQESGSFSGTFSSFTGSFSTLPKPTFTGTFSYGSHSHGTHIETLTHPSFTGTFSIPLPSSTA